MKDNKKIIVVDDKDQIIGHRTRYEVDKENLRYRVSALWIKNSKNEVLLARRAYTKSHNPGKWGPAVAGTLEEGESYKENIIKEAKEELGLDKISLKEGPKIKKDGKHKFFAQWFVSIIDKLSEEFKIEKEEVAEVKWFSKNSLKLELSNNPEEFLSSVSEFIDVF